MIRTRVTLALALITVACTGTAADTGALPSVPSGSPVTGAPSSGAPPSSVAPLPARSHGTVVRLPTDLRAEMHGTTWHRGCPVPMSDLRLLTLRYWGFDGEAHEGLMVVNADAAPELVGVFRALFEARFPIKHMALAKRFRPNADPDTKRSVTASFNCRPVVTPAGPGTSLSMHSYGLAVDINPLQNPYVASDGDVRDRFARPYRDRSRDLPGMIHASDVVVRAFASIGWEWGGDWSGGKDYMHFSANGR